LHRTWIIKRFCGLRFGAYDAGMTPTLRDSFRVLDGGWAKSLVAAMCCGVLGLCLFLSTAASGQADPASLTQETIQKPAEAQPSSVAEQPVPADLDSDLDASSVLESESVEEGAEAVMGLVAAWADKIWNLKLFNAAGTDIEVSQIVIALLVLIIGLLFSKRVARMAYRRVARHKRLEGSVAFVVQKIVYYALMLTSVFIALPVAGIPITIFALLGGALAIGVGFGAQNLCNNLISGFILLLERPIRLRDAVEIDGMVGNVQEIGSRSTRIRRGDGIDVLVPNSFFLENPIINWTLTDAAVRGEVQVGIAYGSDTALFEKLLLDAINEQSKVHKTPVPEVLFESFGDNALAFTGYFFMDARSPAERKRVESAIRFRVDELCREHDVCIAFPQRDIHLDTLKPLEIQVVQPKNES